MIDDDIAVTHGTISIIDYVGDGGFSCNCGNDETHGMFSLTINGTTLEVCERCLANIAHCAIDALE